MNFKEFIANLLSLGNDSFGISFSVIVFLSILLGMLLNYLFFTATILRKRKKDFSELSGSYNQMEEKYDNLNKNHQVLLSKSQRQEEELKRSSLSSEDDKNKIYEIERLSNNLSSEKETLKRINKSLEDELLQLKNIFKVTEDDALKTEQRLKIALEDKKTAEHKKEELLLTLDEMEKELSGKEDAAEHSRKAAETQAKYELLEQEYNELKKTLQLNEDSLNAKEKEQLDSLKIINQLKNKIIGLELQLENKVNINQSIENPLKTNSIENKQLTKELLIPIEDEIEQNETLNKTSSIQPHSDKNNSDEDQLSKLKDELRRFLPEIMIPDDLTLINGIDKNLEDKLNSLGIISYEQLIKITDPDFTKKISSVLMLREHTIENEQWIAQAKQLLTRQKINKLTKDIDLNKLFKK